jgi:hypothetical protein
MAAPDTAGPAPANDLVAIEQKRDALAARLVRGGNEDAVVDALSDQIFELDDLILAAPIASKIDVLVKLRIVAQLFNAGLRYDDAAERATRQVIAWLEAQ